MKKFSFLKNFYLSSFGVATNMAVTIFSYPIFISFLGAEVYGLWVTMSVVVTLGEMGNIGIAQASVKYVSQNLNIDNYDKAQGYFSTGLLFVVFIAGLFLVASLVFSQLILNLLGVDYSIEMENYVRLLGLIGGLSFLISYQFGALTASKMNYITPLFMALRNCVKLSLGVLFFVFFKMQIEGIVYATAISTFLTFCLLAMFIQTKTVLKPFALSKYSKEHFIEMLRYGLTVFGAKVSNILLIPMVKLTVAKTIGFSSVAFFELSYNSAFAVRSLFERGLITIIPEASAMTSYRTTLALVKKSMKFILPAAAVCYLGIVVFANDLIQLWLREDFDPLVVEGFTYFNIAFFISLLGVPAYYIFMGIGQPKYCLYESVIKLSVTYSILFIGYFTANDLRLEMVFLAVSGGFGVSHIYLVITYLIKIND